MVVVVVVVGGGGAWQEGLRLEPDARLEARQVSRLYNDSGVCDLSAIEPRTAKQRPGKAVQQLCRVGSRIRDTGPV